MREGIFVSFEGTEGCGKSTQIALLEERLSAGGRKVVRVREPGGTAAGEVVRDLLQHAPEGEGLVPEAELLLFAASRAQLVREFLLPRLAEGYVVIADRFHDSTTVYQGGGRGLDAGAVSTVNRFAMGDCLPAATFLLDIDLDTAAARLADRGEAADRMEREPSAFFEKVRDGYRALAQREPERIHVIDAARSPDVVAAAIGDILERKFDGIFG